MCESPQVSALGLRCEAGKQAREGKMVVAWSGVIALCPNVRPAVLRAGVDGVGAHGAGSVVVRAHAL